MSLQEFSTLMEIPLGGLDIFGCSAVRADFGFPEAAIQETLFLHRDTPISTSSVTNYRLPVRMANRILSFNLLNKAGNYDDIHDNVRAMLTCIMRRTKINWILYILKTMARPNLRSLSFANQITTLLHLKDIPLGNWAFITPAVNAINIGGLNKMIVSSTPETLRELVYSDPPPTDLLYTEKVVEVLNKAKAFLAEIGKNVDHIPDYRVSSKRKIRKFLPSSSSAPPPPVTTEAPPSPPPATQTAPLAPARTSREDRILDAMTAMSLRQENFARYMHDGMTMIHEENAYMAQKFDDLYAHHDAVSSIQDPPPALAPGFPFSWPPPSYYVAFPSTARVTDDAPGGSGAGPSGSSGVDPSGDGAGPSGDVAGSSGAGDAPVADPMDT